MVELSGSLAGSDLLPLLKLLSELRQTGSLQLSRPGWTAWLDLRDGRVVSASFNGERGPSALTALGLVTHDADFVDIEGPPPNVQELDLTPDGLRVHFESAAGIGTLALDMVPRPIVEPDLAADDDLVALHRGTVRQLLAIDGRRTLGEILGGRPNPTAMLDLARLVRLGLIGLEPGPWPSLENGVGKQMAGPASTAQPGQPAMPRLDGDSHEDVSPAACSKLGFADSPQAHFARPSGVHRCYAGGSAQPVSILEQREYCLSGEYGMCPRLGPQREALAVAELPASRGIARQHEAVSASHAPAPEQTEETGPVVPSAPVARGGSRVDALLPRVSIGLAVLAIAAVVVAYTQTRLNQSGVVVRPPDVQAQVTLEGRPTALPDTGAPVQVSVEAASTPSSSTQPAPKPTEPSSASPAPTAAVPTVTAPAAPQPSARQGEAAPAFAVGAQSVLLLDSQFARRQPGWIDRQPFVAWADGAYRMSARSPGRFVAVAAPIAGSLGDVSVSATMRKVGGPPGGGYGLIVRDQQPAQRDGALQTGQFYVFEVGDLGEFGVWRRDGDGWTDLQTWTPSPLVRTAGATNELLVRIVGDRMSFSINGSEAITEVDGTLFAGSVGLFVGGDGNEVVVDRFTATAPGEGPE
jgi:hypothetical protein